VRSTVEVGGESLDHLKKSLNNWFAKEEQRLAHTRRPPVKRFKSSTESLQIKRKKSGETTQNKC
ncbi:7146_t:CDS:2, partial [Ambispora gerdemannii]